MIFRNIPLKSVLLWDSVDSNYDCKINVYGKKEGLPTEYQYEFEQEMLKHVHELKNELRSNGWSQRESPQVQQTSFLRSDESDGQLGFKFE